jgi:hypothetical protein
MSLGYAKVSKLVTIFLAFDVSNISYDFTGVPFVGWDEGDHDGEWISLSQEPTYFKEVIHPNSPQDLLRN